MYKGCTNSGYIHELFVQYLNVRHEGSFTVTKAGEIK